MGSHQVALTVSRVVTQPLHDCVCETKLNVSANDEKHTRGLCAHSLRRAYRQRAGHPLPPRRRKRLTYAQVKLHEGVLHGGQLSSSARLNVKDGRVAAWAALIAAGSVGGPGQGRAGAEVGARRAHGPLVRQPHTGKAGCRCRGASGGRGAHRRNLGLERCARPRKTPSRSHQHRASAYAPTCALTGAQGAVAGKARGAAAAGRAAHAQCIGVACGGARYGGPYAHRGGCAR
jgi:hypothetical protein